MACEKKFTCDLCGRLLDESRHGFGIRWVADERAKFGDRIECRGSLDETHKHVCLKCVDDLMWEAARHKGHTALTFFAVDPARPLA